MVPPVAAPAAMASAVTSDVSAVTTCVRGTGMPDGTSAMTRQPGTVETAAAR